MAQVEHPEPRTAAQRAQVTTEPVSVQPEGLELLALVQASERAGEVVVGQVELDQMAARLQWAQRAHRPTVRLAGLHMGVNSEPRSIRCRSRGAMGGGRARRLPAVRPPQSKAGELLRGEGPLAVAQRCGEGLILQQVGIGSLGQLLPAALPTLAELAAVELRAGHHEPLQLRAARQRVQPAAHPLVLAQVEMVQRVAAAQLLQRPLELVAAHVQLLEVLALAEGEQRAAQPVAVERELLELRQPMELVDAAGELAHVRGMKRDLIDAQQLVDVHAGRLAVGGRLRSVLGPAAQRLRLPPHLPQLAQHVIVAAHLLSGQLDQVEVGARVLVHLGGRAVRRVGLVAAHALALQHQPVVDELQLADVLCRVLGEDKVDDAIPPAPRRRLGEAVLGQHQLDAQVGIRVGLARLLEHKLQRAGEVLHVARHDRAAHHVLDKVAVARVVLAHHRLLHHAVYVLQRRRFRLDRALQVLLELLHKQLVEGARRRLRVLPEHERVGVFLHRLERRLVELVADEHEAALGGFGAEHALHVLILRIGERARLPECLLQSRQVRDLLADGRPLVADARPPQAQRRRRLLRLRVDLLHHLREALVARLRADHTIRRVVQIPEGARARLEHPRQPSDLIDVRLQLASAVQLVGSKVAAALHLDEVRRAEVVDLEGRELVRGELVLATLERLAELRRTLDNLRAPCRRRRALVAPLETRRGAALDLVVAPLFELVLQLADQRLLVLAGAERPFALLLLDLLLDRLDRLRLLRRLERLEVGGQVEMDLLRLRQLGDLVTADVRAQ